jgi:signal transduction histidine kinase
MTGTVIDPGSPALREIIGLVIGGATGIAVGSHGIILLSKPLDERFRYHEWGGFCERIRAHPKGREACDRDEQCRVKHVLEKKTHWTTCHAHVSNLVAPVATAAETYGMLFANQFRDAIGNENAQRLDLSLLASELGEKDTTIWDSWLRLPMREPPQGPNPKLQHAGELAAALIAAVNSHDVISREMEAFRHLYNETLSVPADEAKFWQSIGQSFARVSTTVGAECATIVVFSQRQHGQTQARVKAASGLPPRFADKAIDISGTIIAEAAERMETISAPYDASQFPRVVAAGVGSLGRPVHEVALLPMAFSSDEKGVAVFFVNETNRKSTLPMAEEAGWLEGWIRHLVRAYEISITEKTRNEWLTKVCHQVCAPLTSIEGFAETLLLDRVLGGRRERDGFTNAIESIRAAAEWTSALAKNFAWLGYTERLKKQTTLALETDVYGTLVDCARGAQGIATIRGLQIHCEAISLAALNDKFRANYNLLRQIMLNLLNNAIKYSHIGTAITVYGQVKSRGASGSFCQIAVENYGIRLTEDDRERVFEERYRTREAEEREPGGTGIGLPVAREMAALQGGNLYALASEDVGNGCWKTTFLLEFPMV